MSYLREINLLASQITKIFNILFKIEPHLYIAYKLKNIKNYKN